MKSPDIDDMLERLSRQPVPEPGRGFNTAVWRRIDRHDRSRNAWLAALVPALGWRAVPACLALVVGSLAGTAMIRDRQPDALDAFDPQSAYSIIAVIGTGTGAR